VVCAMRERTPFPRALIERLPKLKLLITSGMRNAAIDMEAAKARGIVVCGTQYGRDPTAPLAMGLILELTRRIGQENARMHAGEPWQALGGVEIEGKTLGVIGLGKLGTKVAGLATAFGMNVIAWSPNLTPERCKDAGVGYATRDELFATADVITIHVVLSDRSRGLVGAPEIARMKPTAYLVNTSRAPIIDEAALLQALRERRIGGAALDVFSVEPLPADHPLRGLDNVVLTPHLGYVTEESFRAHYGQMVDCIAAWLGGTEPPRRLA
jgi:phosphoglycerate dehydrogenase-like enzyme